MRAKTRAISFSSYKTMVESHRSDAGRKRKGKTGATSGSRDGGRPRT
jgi:hypothetical protein